MKSSCANQRLIGSTWSGKQANAAQFVSANSQFMSIPDNSSVSMGSGAKMTVGAWVYLNSNSTIQNIVAKRSNFSGNLEYFLRYENNTFKFSVSPDGTTAHIESVSTAATITTGMWYFVTAGYDGTNLWIEYNNGARQTKAYALSKPLARQWSMTLPKCRPKVSFRRHIISPMERYRIVEGVGLYYVTFTVVEWLPVFIDESACKIVTDSFNFCIKNKSLAVNAYVIMPTHLHATLFDVEFSPERLKSTLDNMRKFTGRQLLDHAATHLPKSFTEEFQTHAGKDRERRFWQPTQHPIGITSNGFWKQKMDYIHANPCRKGLVVHPEDWRFSSARFWLTKEKNDVQLSDVGWD